MADETLGPPVIPSFKLPPQILANPPDLPRPNLDAPSADLPSFKPMLVPSNILEVPDGIKSEEEEENEGKPQPPEVKKVTVPWTNYQIPIPQENMIFSLNAHNIIAIKTHTIPPIMDTLSAPGPAEPV